MAPASRMETTSCGWPAWELVNDWLRLIAVPELGGRILVLEIAGHNLLYTNPDFLKRREPPTERGGDGTFPSWRNYGGDKTWPAPQASRLSHGSDTFHGPPDPVLDSGPYSASAMGATGLRMVSQPDPRTGLRLAREVVLRDGGAVADLHLEMTNVSQQPARWSIWDVAQMCCSPYDAARGESDCRLFVPLRQPSRHVPGYQVVFGAPDNPGWADARPGLLAVSYYPWAAKIGVDSDAGWLVFIHGSTGTALCFRFPVDLTAEYPDDGSTVEVWLSGPMDGHWSPEQSGLEHLEAEILSPMHRLAPDETVSFDINWNACRLATMPNSVYGVNVYGCVVKPLAVAPETEGAHVQGEFGVFWSGQAEGRWLDRQGGYLGTTALGPVSPLAPLVLDVALWVPSGAEVLSLWVRPEAGAAPGELARATVPSEGNTGGI